MTKIRPTLALALMPMAVLALTACDREKTEAEKADAANRAAQNDVKARATRQQPVPQTSNFQARKNLTQYLQRLDEPGKVWYVYERARATGEIIGRYTSSTYPQSVCTFMTQPEEIQKLDIQGAVTTTAMALDGVYYKGGDCPDFFFDYRTGALVILDSDALTVAVDRPLEIDAPAFSFRSAASTAPDAPTADASARSDE